MSTRNMSINLVWTILVFLAVDLYLYWGLRKSFDKHKWRPWLHLLYLGLVALSYVGLYYLYYNFTFKPLQVNWTMNLAIGFFFSFLVFRITMFVFFFLEDIFRLSRLSVLFVRRLLLSGRGKMTFSGRRGFIRQTGLLVAGVPFSSMLYGITKGKYDFKIREFSLSFENLPEAFDGFRIVQISDIHSGSFDSREEVLKGIEMVEQQHADMILFSGDLVNNDSKEILPYIEDFKKLSAPYGVFSVLGNHDYGDYKQWDSVEAKQHNMELLYEFQERMGFKLLNNDHEIIEKGSDQIGIFGVENWGNPPFPQRGDLDRALSGAEDCPFKILLSHDPTHWDKRVSDHPIQVDLTLSGHTHGMQFGVEIPGFKWSPIKYIYPQWAGLYNKNNRLLYVNRGFGYLGFPGRVGIWPEITTFELTRKI